MLGRFVEGKVGRTWLSRFHPVQSKTQRGRRFWLFSDQIFCKELCAIHDTKINSLFREGRKEKHLKLSNNCFGKILTEKNSTKEWPTVAVIIVPRADELRRGQRLHVSIAASHEILQIILRRLLLGRHNRGQIIVRTRPRVNRYTYVQLSVRFHQITPARNQKRNQKPNRCVYHQKTLSQSIAL